MSDETLAKRSKDLFEALEKCHQTRAQLKQRLNREGLLETQELEWARELYSIDRLIALLEKERASLVENEIEQRSEPAAPRTGGPPSGSQAAEKEEKGKEKGKEKEKEKEEEKEKEKKE